MTSISGSDGFDGGTTASPSTIRDGDSFVEECAKFFSRSECCDVTLSVHFGDAETTKSFKCHRFLLAKSSEVFERMLYTTSFKESDMSNIDLYETNECGLVFDKFLTYLATAAVDLSAESAFGILSLADKYQVTSLKQLTIRFMFTQSRAPLYRNALTYLICARQLSVHELVEHCLTTLAWSASEILKSDEWKRLDLEIIELLLRRSDIVINDEMAIFTAVSGWLLHQHGIASTVDPILVKSANLLLPLVRYSQMSIGALREIENSELNEWEMTRDLLKRLLGDAFRFRCFWPDRKALGLSEAFTDDISFAPRNYGHLEVDVVKIRNTLRFGIQVDVKMYVGAVLSEKKEGDWKLTYKNQQNVWSLTVSCHDSAMIDGSIKFQITVLIFNADDKVIQLRESPAHFFERRNRGAVTLNIHIDNFSEAQTMSVLIKHLP